MADPIRALTSASYTSLAQYYHGAMAYSYVFFGQVGATAAIRLRTSMCGVCVLAGEPMFWMDKGGAGGQPSVPLFVTPRREARRSQPHGSFCFLAADYVKKVGTFAPV